MAGSKSDAFELDVLKATVGQTTTILTTTPITPWVALFTVAPTDSTGGTEVSGGSYARVNSSGLWGTPASGQVANGSVITFPTATGAWGTVVAFAIMTASSGGSMLRWGDLTTSRSPISGDTPQFAVGALVLTED